MTALREAAQRALEALKSVPCDVLYEQQCNICNAIDFLSGVLKEAEKERHPVAWMWWGDNGDGTESKYVHIGRDFPTYWKPVRPPVPLFTNNSDLVLHQSATSKHKRRL